MFGDVLRTQERVGEEYVRVDYDSVPRRLFGISGVCGRGGLFPRTVCLASFKLSYDQLGVSAKNRESEHLQVKEVR